jgi:hypothetical protein
VDVLHLAEITAIRFVGSSRRARRSTFRNIRVGFARFEVQRKRPELAAPMRVAGC